MDVPCLLPPQPEALGLGTVCAGPCLNALVCLGLDWMKPGLLVTLSAVYSCFCLAFTSFLGSLATSASQVVKSEGKGAKRKTPEEEKNGGEELVEKKVCKGFQTV